MTRKGPSYYVESVGPQEAALVQGFQWLIAEARKTGNKGLIAVSTKQNLDNIAGWSQFGPVLSQLRKNGVASLGDVTLGLFTAKDQGIHKWDGPVLAIYGGQKLLDAVDSIPGTASVCYVAWSEGDYLAWSQTWGASKLGQQTKKVATQQEPTKGAALFALRSLSESVNLTTGISHSSDRQEAIKTLETLFHKHADVTPETIRQQLVRLGWQPNDAGEVKKFAEMIWEGRRPKGSKGKADDALWNYWNEKAGHGEV